MRGFIVMAMFAVSLAQAESGNYTEVRELTLQSAGLTEFVIDAGAGSLVVTGVDDAAEIMVTATIIIEDKNEKDALKLIEKRLDLELERDGERAELKSGFNSSWHWDGDATIDLDVRMPAGIALNVDDGSGSTTISGVTADVLVDDGSGSIQVTNAGSVTVDDVEKDLIIEDDGSGGVTFTNVRGSVEQDT